MHFLGKAGTVAAFSGLASACKRVSKATNTVKKNIPLVPLAPSTQDALQLTSGFQYEVLIRWEDPISSKDRFGMHNDYLAFQALDNKKDEGLLWVNHEYLSPLFVSGFNDKDLSKKTKAQVDKEMYAVGGSILHIKKQGKRWELVKNSEYNRRITAQTPLPFDWHEPILGANQGIGTLGNCAGGVTPWGSILTCEENYDMFYGETDYTDPQNPKRKPSTDYGWEYHYNYPPEHYGWVVEVDLKTGKGKKLIALGRCAHECATTFRAPDGRMVVYTGDDHNDECLYKFVSSKPNSLSEGTLYVANIEKGQWISLKYEDQPLLQKHFKSQTEVLIRLREAAHLLGGSRLNRPEDIEIDPTTGHVLISLTNNKAKGDFLGSILKIEEGSSDKTGTSFRAETFLAGGPELGFACPDNLAFDKKGNLWFTSDISGSSIEKGPYKGLGNNGLFVVPVQGPQKGKVIRIANAPKDAELTGPYFAPDGSLFLSVQHPGEETQSLDQPSSHFPDGGTTLPRSCVVVITGEGLQNLVGNA